VRLPVNKTSSDNGKRLVFNHQSRIIFISAWPARSSFISWFLKKPVHYLDMICCPIYHFKKFLLRLKVRESGSGTYIGSYLLEFYKIDEIKEIRKKRKQKTKFGDFSPDI